MAGIDDLESSIDIVELVKRYTNLKKAGANYKALCPFPGHTENTPSFVVSPSKQLWYCFGCHRGGWPLKFVMDVENATFKEAVEILSNITWVKVAGMDFKEEKVNKNIYSVMQDITNYYKKSLQNYPEVKKYLMDRGLSSDSISSFDFWYADSGVELYWYLKEKWYWDELIEETNVFLDIKSKKDKFIGRIIFPIRNARGDIVAFAGRIIGAWEPKYLNSPASKLYDKSNILYGLFQARNEITKKDFIIVTEWYMDTISLHQAWYKNTVCVSGTALTEKHITLIKRLTKRIYLCFDNDKAGQNATNLAIEMLKNKELEVKIISLSGAKDPDEILKNGGNFQDFIDTALSPIGYSLENMKEISWLSDKRELLKKILELIKSYQDNIEKDYYLKEVSDKLDIKLDLVYFEYNKTKLSKSRDDNFVYKTQVSLSSEDLVIGLLLRYPDKFDMISENILYREYLWDDIKKLISEWVDVISNFEIEKKNKYLALAQSDEMLQIKAQLEWDHIVQNEEKILQNIQKTTEKLNQDTLKKLESNLKERIKNGDMEALLEYNTIMKGKKK